MAPCPLTPYQIAKLLNTSVVNVTRNWHLVKGQLGAHGIYSQACAIAALATIRVECPPFRPIKEYGSAALHNLEYDRRTDLGNTAAADGDGEKYCGRGFIQITGRANYEFYSKALNIDLVSSPDLALEPAIAAKIFARFFRDHKVHEAARAGEWVEVRHRVNGGRNGLADFIRWVGLLEAEIAETAELEVAHV